MYVPAMAVAYLALQLSAFFWATPGWRKLGRLPLWIFGGATIALVVGGALGAPLAHLLLLMSLPTMTFYLGFLWMVYLIAGPRDGLAGS